MEAVAVLNSNNIYGYVLFTETENSTVQVKVDLFKKSIEGVIPSESFHGFHIHASGDLRRGCDSCCKHYNPKGKTHGGLFDENSHAGDLGNIRFDEKGNCKDYFETDKFNVQEILGRSIIIHENPDDLGLGIGEAREESLKTGNAKKRLACAVIGLSENTCQL